jgi:sensor histidine kinase regulating citrate/malate metabolism
MIVSIAIAIYFTLKNNESEKRYAEIRKKEHDYGNTINTIRWLPASNSPNLAERIDELLGTDVATADPEVNTGNELIDCIINGKFAKARSFGISVELKSTPLTPVINSRNIVQILGIMLDNSIDACMDIKKRTSRTVQPMQPTIKLKLQQIDETILIKIWDNGTLIPKKTIPHIFKRGVSTKKDTNTDQRGFGLASVKELAESVNVTQNRNGKEFEVYV